MQVGKIGAKSKARTGKSKSKEKKNSLAFKGIKNGGDKFCEVGIEILHDEKKKKTKNRTSANTSKMKVRVGDWRE